VLLLFLLLEVLLMCVGQPEFRYIAPVTSAMLSWTMSFALCLQEVYIMQQCSFDRNIVQFYGALKAALFSLLDYHWRSLSS